MATLFTHWQIDPSGILDPAFVGIFDGEFKVDRPIMLERVPSSACHETPLVLVCFKAIFKELLAVTCQLADFLVDGKFGHEPTEEDKAILSHCPSTNLIGENAFGDMDFDLGKRRHCSLHHRTTTHMLKRNKTSKWLDSKVPAESSSMLKTAKKNAKMLRRKHRKQERLVKMKVKEQVLENEGLKKLKEVQGAEQKQKIIQSVLEHGGPCASARDVRKLVGKTRTVSKSLLALKAEIRHQKTVKTVLGVGGWGVGLRLTGSWEDPPVRLTGSHDSQEGPQTYWVMGVVWVGWALRLTGSRVSSDGLLWSVPEVKMLEKGYQRIKQL